VVLAYFQPLTVAVLRLFVAFLIWQHSAQKLFGMVGGEQAGIFTGAWVLGLLEFVGSLALGIGFLARPIAAVLAVELLVLYLIVYLPAGFPPYGARLGEQIIMLALASGFLAFAGPGRVSVDADLRHERPELDPRWFGDGLERYYPEALGAFRILFALIFLQHGLPKLGIGGEAADLLTQRWVAGVVETFGGLAIALGLFTRTAAFISSGQMAFAYFMSHAPRGFFPVENAGDRAALFCFFFLCLVPAGPGRWALDGWLHGRSKRAGKAQVAARI
jgi:putative oxidoreductase